jgi:hypothetical protein
MEGAMENENEKRRRLYKEYLDAFNRYLEACGAPFRVTAKGLVAYEITSMDASELSPGDRDLLEKMKRDSEERERGRKELEDAKKKPAFDADAFRDAVREKIRAEMMFAGVADLAEKIANGRERE